MTRHAIAARAAAALVAAVAGAASWEHIASVALAVGERPWVAWSLPAAIDGLIVVGVMALMEDARAGRSGRWSARVAVVAGVAMTLAANIASAEATWTARAVAVAAPVSFLLAVEVLTRSGRVRPAEGNAQRPAAAGRGGRKGQRARRPGDAAAKVAAAMAAQPDASVAQLARLAGVSRSTVRRVNGSPVAAGGDDGDVRGSR